MSPASRCKLCAELHSVVNYAANYRADNFVIQSAGFRTHAFVYAEGRIVSIPSTWFFDINPAIFLTLANPRGVRPLSGVDGICESTCSVC